MSPPPPPAGEADEAPAAPASKRPWAKPRIKPLKVLTTDTGTKTHQAVDEDSATGPDDPLWTYTAHS